MEVQYPLAYETHVQNQRGAFQTVHGIGESLRGNTMDFVDFVTGTENRSHGAAVRGQ